MPVGADPHDDKAGVDRQRQLAGDAATFERAGRRRLHPDVGNLPQRHQQIEAARLFEIKPHRQLILGDFGLVASVRAGAAGQLRREEAEHIAAVTFDMDHLRAEFGQLRADIGLRDKHASADRADTFKRAERRVLGLALEAGLEGGLGELGARHPLAGLWRGLCHRGLFRIASQRHGQAVVPGLTA